ncbi:LOW QUALITY PROTEIN: hypothetical protein CRUP_008374, partial [Coryphaenoides rupestris]
MKWPSFASNSHADAKGPRPASARVRAWEPVRGPDPGSDGPAGLMPLEEEEEEEEVPQQPARYQPYQPASFQPQQPASYQQLSVVENAVRQGKTGLACTDGQNQWNSGAKKNAGQHKMKRMSFKRHNRHQFYSSAPCCILMTKDLGVVLSFEITAGKDHVVFSNLENTTSPGRRA